MSSLSGKVAIVTGGSRGIGVRIATRLAQAGAGVVVNYAGRRDAAEQVVQSIEAGGGRALAVQGDVSKPQDVRALFDSAVERFGRVHILVNNAEMRTSSAAMAALGRIGQPEDIANLVLFLASDEAGWISAQNIGANGGLA